jgi:hypothetical protein
LTPYVKRTIKAQPTHFDVLVDVTQRTASGRLVADRGARLNLRVLRRAVGVLVLLEVVRGDMAAEAPFGLPVEPRGETAALAIIVVVVPAPLHRHGDAVAAIGRGVAGAIGVVPVQAAARFDLRHMEVAPPIAGRAEEGKLVGQPKALAPRRPRLAARLTAAVTCARQARAALDLQRQLAVVMGEAAGRDEVGQAADRAPIVLRKKGLRDVDAAKEVRRQHFHQDLSDLAPGIRTP